MYYFIYILSTSKKINKTDFALSTELKDLEAILIDLKGDKGILENKITRDPKNSLIIAVNALKKYKIAIPKIGYNEIEKFPASILKELVILQDTIENDIEREKNIEDNLKKDFSASIIYEVDNKIREINYINKKFEYSIYNPDKKIRIKNTKRVFSYPFKLVI